ncbi:MAG: hypothetical protein ACI84D_000693 [Thalassolituus oleivorans]|jgi:hypothetical protein
MSWGTINDVGTAGQVMSDIMTLKGYDLTTVVLNEGHSWGSWRATLDDVFEYFWGAGSNVAVSDTPSPETLEFDLFPNPSGGAMTVRGGMGLAKVVRIVVYDMLGRRSGAWLAESTDSGGFRADIDLTGAAPGLYVVRLEMRDGSAVSRPILLGR